MGTVERNTIVILFHGNNTIMGIYDNLDSAKQIVIKEQENSRLIFEDYKEGWMVTIIFEDKTVMELYARIWEVETLANHYSNFKNEK